MRKWCLKTNPLQQEVAEEKLGTPYEKAEEGYCYYKYRQEVSEDRTAMVVIEFEDDTREIEQFTLYYVFTEDFRD